MSDAALPFEIRVPEPVLMDLRERLARTRWIDTVAGVGWDHGLDVSFLRDLARYWHDGFDWRREEQALNRFPQIVTTIDGLRVHAIHQRSPERDALPRRAGHFGPLSARVEVPTGCAIFPREIFRPPRRWAEALYRVVHWSEHAEGGHFAAMEVPELLIEDIRTFFRPLRG
jgi:hypothetical protein